MRWTQITEGAEVTCSRCDDLIGKAKELPKGKVTCGVCGNTENNPYGYEHSKGAEEKFGRLSFTNVTVEDGCTQGRLETSKGQPLGSLIQYGSQWHDYDDGKWEAYCMAIKKRKKGFADKKKAVDWIVRQTRAAMKTPVGESDLNEFAASQERMIFGRTVPNKGEGHEADYAVYGSDDNRQVQIVFNNGTFEVMNNGKRIARGSAQEIEDKLTKYRLTNFLGIAGNSTLDVDNGDQ